MAIVLTKEQTAAVKRRAQDHVKLQKEYFEKRPPREPITDEQWAEYERGCETRSIEESIDLIYKTPVAVQRAATGWFHPSNKASRRLFTGITGLRLPNGVGASARVVEEYFEGAIAAYWKAKEDESVAARVARELEQERIEAKRLAEIEQRVRDDKAISGMELVDLARHLDIDVHPRTVSTLRHKVFELRRNTGRVAKNLRDSTSAWKVYRQCVSALQEQPV